MHSCIVVYFYTVDLSSWLIHSLSYNTCHLYIFSYAKSNKYNYSDSILIVIESFSRQFSSLLTVLLNVQLHQPYTTIMRVSYSCQFTNISFLLVLEVNLVQPPANVCYENTKPNSSSVCGREMHKLWVKTSVKHHKEPTFLF